MNKVGAEVRLAYLEAKVASFLETVPDAMILSDQQGRIVLVNSNTERMFGYSRDELLGKEIEDPDTGLGSVSSSTKPYRLLRRPQY